MRRRLEVGSSTGDDDDGGCEPYRDERELIIQKEPTLNEVLSYFINTQFFKSKLYKEIIDGFYVLLRYCDVMDCFSNPDITGLLTRYYFQLFYDDIKEHEYTFKSFYLSDHKLHSIISICKEGVSIIECFTCKTPFLFRNSFIERLIYGELSDGQSLLIAYNRHLKQYQCSNCETFNICKTCNRLASQQEMITKSKCLDCLHAISHQSFKRCSYHSDDIKSYKRVYKCTICSRYHCEFDTFISKPYYCCTRCINRWMGMSPYDNDDFLMFYYNHHCNRDYVDMRAFGDITDGDRITNATPAIIKALRLGFGENGNYLTWISSIEEFIHMLLNNKNNHR